VAGGGVGGQAAAGAPAPGAPPPRNFAVAAHLAVPLRGVEDAAPYGGNPWTFPLPHALTAARGLAANNWINQKENAPFIRALFFFSLIGTPSADCFTQSASGFVASSKIATASAFGASVNLATR